MYVKTKLQVREHTALVTHEYWLATFSEGIKTD